MIHLILVDDQNFTRQALKAILQTEANFTILGEANNGVQALELMDRSEVDIDIAIVDLDMPEMNGFELTKQICHRFPKTKVIILSGYEDRASINKAVSCGARGYLLKNSSTQEIVDTIEYVKRGYFQLGAGLFEQLISNLINNETETSNLLLQLKLDAERSVSELKQEIILQKKEIYHELLEELNIQLDSLKSEFRQGLYIFQNQVSEQVNDGLDIIHKNQRDSQSNIESWEQRFFQLVHKINVLESSYKFQLKKLEKENSLMRYGLIFLLVAFFVEKAIVLFFTI